MTERYVVERTLEGVAHYYMRPDERERCWTVSLVEAQHLDLRTADIVADEARHEHPLSLVIVRTLAEAEHTDFVARASDEGLRAIIEYARLHRREHEIDAVIHGLVMRWVDEEVIAMDDPRVEMLTSTLASIAGEVRATRTKRDAEGTAPRG